MLLGMVPMSSINISNEDKETALKIARESIIYGIENGSALKINTNNYSPYLQQTLASFVTLHKHGNLRGCIGALEAYQPLINDISDHAFAAAFQDSRFPAVTANELSELDIEISVLTKPVEMSFTSEEDLLDQIRPGIDGLILEHGFNRGTFLPSVWEQLPEVNDFFQHLKIKAGLDKSWWSDDVKISRYETIKF